MSNQSIVANDAAPFTSPIISDHHRRVLKLYAKMIAYNATTDYTTAANLPTLFSAAKALLSAYPQLENDPCTAQECALWFAYAVTTGGANVALANASVSAKLLACAAWLNQTDRAIAEADLYLTGKLLTAFT